MTNEQLTDLTDDALHAFWQVIVERFPQAVSGDLSPITSFCLSQAAETAVSEWIDYNVPSKFRR
jgi:hypothetical protein